MVFQHEQRSPGVRLHIAGRWTAQEMALQLATLDYLYNIDCLADAFSPDSRSLPQFAVIQARGSLLSPSSPVRRALIQYLTRMRWTPVLGAMVPVPCSVRAIEYASPGFQDFAGIAAGFRVILKGIQYYCDRHRRQEKHDAEMTTMRLQQELLRIEIAQKYAQFLRDARLSAKEQRLAMQMWLERQTLLWSLVEQGKIRSIDDKT